MLNLKSFIKNRLNKPIESPAPKVAKLEMGDVEYTIVGQGKPILIIHGGGGGYDQAVLMFQRYIPEGYQMICPSRPGYLNTPITTGKSFDKQADALAALLDYLHIPSAVVVSISSIGTTRLTRPISKASLALYCLHKNQISLAFFIPTISAK